jgi:cupin 2 domain-containing protein
MSGAGHRGDVGNLYARLPHAATAEEFTELLSRPGCRIERIVSTGQSSPPGFWYDQVQAEWILLVAGGASLRFEDEAQPRHLKAGDYVEIAAHRRHRVEATQADPPTIWLAVYIGPQTAHAAA